MQWIVYKIPVDVIYMPEHFAEWKSYQNLMNSTKEKNVPIKVPQIDQEFNIEDLNIKEMLEERKLSREISDVSWYEFMEQLRYKSLRHDKKLVKVDRYFASSQICNCCGFVNKEIKDLSIREWTCPKCGKHHDRDVNASINILKEGLKLI